MKGFQVKSKVLRPLNCEIITNCPVTRKGLQTPNTNKLYGPSIWVRSSELGLGSDMVRVPSTSTETED